MSWLDGVLRRTIGGAISAHVSLSLNTDEQSKVCLARPCVALYLDPEDAFVMMGSRCCCVRLHPASLCDEMQSSVSHKQDHAV